MSTRRAFVSRFALAGGITIAAGSRGLGQSGNGLKTASKSGIATVVDGEKVYLNSSSGPITVVTKPSTRVWKGEFGMTANAIRPGDDVAVRGVINVHGTFVASEIWVNITILDGIIKSISGNLIVVDVIRNDGASQTTSIKISNATLSSQDVPLRNEQLAIGRHVQVIGLALEDGTVSATRVRVYVNGRPIDSTGTKYVDPLTGRIIDKP